MRQTRSFCFRPMLVGLWLLILLSACSDDNSSGSVPVSGPPLPVLETAGPGSALLPSDRLSITSPVRLAAYNDSAILVADYKTNKVLIVDKATLLPLAGFNLFRHPSGVAFSGDKFFVGNQATQSVDVFDATSKFLYYLGGKPGEFLQVNDLAVDPAADLVYVLDTKAAVVRIYNTGGSYTGRQIGLGILRQPTALTLAADTGNLLISDFGDLATGVLPAIRIFAPSGAQIDVVWGGFNKTFVNTPLFSSPQGVGANGAHIFVADAISGEIQVFSLTDKKQVKVLGQLGTDIGDLRYPLDVFVDSLSRDVFIADNGNGRITVFRGGGVLP